MNRYVGVAGIVEGRRLAYCADCPSIEACRTPDRCPRRVVALPAPYSGTGRWGVADGAVLPLPERHLPTHTLRIEIPLNLSEPPPDIDIVAEALRLSLAIGRAAFSGRICDDPQVTMEERGDAA